MYYNICGVMGEFLSIPHKLLTELTVLSFSARWVYLKLLCGVIFSYRTRKPRGGTDIVSGVYEKDKENYGISKPSYLRAMKELVDKEFIVCVEDGKFGVDRKGSSYRLLRF